MRRSALGVTLALVLAVPAAVGASASGPPRLEKQQLAPKTCGTGALVISVVQWVLNDLDSGTKGNFWALDDYSRSIKVWKLGDHNFCAIATYSGSFTTIAGPSPDGDGTVAAGVRGRLEGGYRMDFRATRRTRPARPTRGFIGTFDYRCDPSGRCLGSSYWLRLYFSGVTGDELDWWGWLYKAQGNAGTWLNTVDGTKGDITTAKGQRGKKK